MQGPMEIQSNRFETEDVMSLFERVMTGIGGLFCLAPAWEFFGKQIVNPFQLVLLPFWFIGLAAGSIAVPLVTAAILGGRQTISIDGEHRILTVRRLFWQRWGWTRRWAFNDLGPVAVVMDNWTDGPPTWRLCIGRRDLEPLVLRTFSNATDAEAARIAIVRMLAR